MGSADRAQAGRCAEPAPTSEENLVQGRAGWDARPPASDAAPGGGRVEKARSGLGVRHDPGTFLVADFPTDHHCAGAVLDLGSLVRITRAVRRGVVLVGWSPPPAPGSRRRA